MKVSKKKYYFQISTSRTTKYIYICFHNQTDMVYKLNQQDWIKQLCSGEEEAYCFFFEQYYSILGVFALKYVKEQAIAEDIVNDVIFELYSSKRVFLDIVSLKSFLFTSIKNRSLNYLRDRKARERYLHDPQTTNDTEEFFLDTIIEEEIYFLMQKALTELPDKIRKIYKLSLSGESNEAIATQLNLTVDSVKAYKKRGKQMLKEKLQNLFTFLSVSI